MVEEYYVPQEELVEDLEDEQMEEQAEKEADAAEEAQTYDTTPTYVAKDDLYTLLKWVIARDDSSKVGNLLKEELGMLDISVRDCQRIALLANTLRHPGFAKFFKLQGEIVLATSLSRKGELLNLFVTQRKFTTKAREIKPLVPLQPQKKKKFF